MREGRLGYNCENGRYGLLSMDLWIDTGFHCGECMEVLVDDQWVKTCLLYTSPSPRDLSTSRMPSSA